MAKDYLKTLIAERDKLNRAIAILQDEETSASPKPTRNWSPAAKAEVSKRMKAYWAKRRKAKK